MFIDPTPAEPETQGDQAQRTQRHLRVLDEMVEISLDVMRQVQTLVHAEVETAIRRDQPAREFTVALERVSRTIRRTILLAQKIAQPAKAPAVHPVKDRVAARKQIIRTVEDLIDRDAPADEAESLHAELLDRLDSPDLEYDIANRPVEDIIVEMRRDLGLAAQAGKRRTPEDVALLHARASAPCASAGPVGSPLPPHCWTENDLDKAEAAHWPGAIHIRDP
jgi:hypothetical protein